MRLKLTKEEEALEPNKDDEALKNGYGIPGWLELSGSLSELCMVINSSLDGFIYMDEDLKTKSKGVRKKGENCTKKRVVPSQKIDRKGHIDFF